MSKDECTPLGRRTIRSKGIGIILSSLVIIRITYSDGIAMSIACPAVFDGDLAAINAADYVKKLMVIPADRGINCRTEYMVLPAAHRDSVCGTAPLYSDDDRPEQTGIRLRRTVTVRKLGS